MVNTNIELSVLRTLFYIKCWRTILTQTQHLWLLRYDSYGMSQTYHDERMFFQNIRFHLPSNDRRNMERSTHDEKKRFLARKNLLVLKWEFLVTEFTMMQYIDLYLFWLVLPFEEFRTEWPFETVMSLLFAPRYNALVALQVYVTNGAFETLTWAIFLKNMDWQPVTKHTLNLHLTKYRSCVYGHGRSRP